MKKWILTLMGLGYLSPVIATQQESFLVTGEDIKEVSYFNHFLETPNFFTRVYPTHLNPNGVLITRTNSGFFFGVTGLFQRAFDNQLDFAIDEPSTPLYLPSLNSRIRALDPSYDFGYGAYIGYVYPYSARDVELDAYNLDSNVRDSISGLSDSFVWTPLALYSQATTADSASSTVSTDMTQARLMVGQHFFAGSRFRIHPSLGVKYAAISRDLDTTYSLAGNLVNDPFGTAFVNQKSRFNGLGPAFALDTRYFFAPHFGFVSHLTSAILIGSINSEIRYQQNIDFPVDFSFSSGTTAGTGINLKSSDRVVPNLEAKLGLLYEYPFCGTTTKLEVELGYGFNHFFNGVDSYRSAGAVVNVPTDPATVSPVITANTPFHIKQVHDLTLDGPYLSIGLRGIACPENLAIDPICVSTPRLEGGFVFGIGGAYYRIHHNQRDFALVDPQPTVILADDPAILPATFLPSLNSNLADVSADYSYGGMLNIGYIFRHTPYDVNLHYEGAQAQDHNSVTAPTEGTIWTILTTPFFNMVESRINATEAKANLKFSYNEVHLDVGQSINAGDYLWLRLFEGIEYANISSNFHTTYSNVNTQELLQVFPNGVFYPQVDVVQKSDFAGYGPRIGIDMALPVGGFALTSQFAGGFLMGNIDAHYKDTYQNGIVITGGVPVIAVPSGELGTNIDSESQISPFVDMKVGVAYTWNFFSRTRWTLELGYKAAHYFNAVTNYRHATNNAAQYVKQVGDATVDGPFLNLSIFGFGACPPDCIMRDPLCAIVPEYRGGFEFAIEGLYLQPHVANVDYATVDPSPTDVPNILGEDFILSGIDLNPSSLSKTQLLTPSYDKGYRVHVGYIFPFTANDVAINYTSYDTTTSAIANAPLGGVVWTLTNGSFGALASDSPTFFPVFAQTAQATADFNWQTGNIEIGRRIKFYHLLTRFFAGLTYAKVSEDITISYLDGFANNAALTPIASDVITQNNNFSGYGPRMGIAADLQVDCGLSLVGLIGTDLLIGNINSNFVETSSSGDSTALNPDNRTRLVPAIDAKFGLAYTVGLLNCTQASVEFGYQINHYFSVKDSLRFTDYTGPFVKQDQDLSFDGPYLRLQLNL